MILLVGGRDAYTRIDVVGDHCPAVSIKEVEHSRRCSGAYQRRMYSAERGVPYTMEILPRQWFWRFPASDVLC